MSLFKRLLCRHRALGDRGDRTNDSWTAHRTCPDCGRSVEMVVARSRDEAVKRMMPERVGRTVVLR